MIKLTKVNKYFNHHKKNEIHVINNASLEIKENGLVALLGPSGCGKTTLLNTIGGLDKINKGKIYVNNKLISRRSSRKIDQIRNANIGYIFQEFHLINDKTVFENVALVLKMVGIKNKKVIKERVDYVLETVGIYRYRNRPAGMLSGGERQRVGIARAIVKNPDLILADEPTGNLDSKNTIEIMNIIKSISKDRIVLLVTHEKDVAKFYASRVIEIKDGVIDNDYINDHQNELDYHMDNKIYLKDLPKQKDLNSNDYKINYYGNNEEPIDLNIVVINNNIYIKSNTKEKVEVVDSNSNIEFIDDTYKKITKQDYEKYQFDLSKLDNSKYKLRYSSIYNIFTLLVNGFKKIFDYSFIKKLLLLGFFISGMFIFYAISNIYGIRDIKDEDFIEQNRYNLVVETPKLTIDKYLELEKEPTIKYMLPGNENVSFNINFGEYYQTTYAVDTINGSLSSINNISKEDLKYGHMPENEFEIVIDHLVIKDLFDRYVAQQTGVNTDEELLNREVEIENMGKFKIVGITKLDSPNIYTSPSQFINILANSSLQPSDGWGQMFQQRDMAVEIPEESTTKFVDYNLKKDIIKLKRGKMPINNYEVMVNYNEAMMYPLNRKIDTKINGEKLKVVGYYTTEKQDLNALLVNNDMIKYNLIRTKDNLTIYPNDKEAALSLFQDKKYNIKESYKVAKDAYVSKNREQMTATIVLSSIILGISFIEIFLIIRSSFLSRIKEVGILRAIGVMKKDIYKMFLGEIIAITTVASIPGFAFMIYIVNRLMQIKFFSGNYLINLEIIIMGTVLIYIFNIVVGLLPVYNTIKKTPAAILSRTDVD